MNSIMANMDVSPKSPSAASKKSSSNNTLTMNNFYQLMAAQFQNQDPSNPGDTGDYINQMMQMAVIDAINTITATTVTTYAASLVGKEVTIASYDSKNNITEVYGTVTATGVYAGEQVIIVDGKTYRLSQIMAIGKLESTDSTDSADTGDSSDTTEA